MPGAQGTNREIGQPEPSAISAKNADRLVLNSLAKARKSGLWLPVRLTLEAWSEIGVQIAAISDSSAWWLGDWLIYGKKKFPDRYKRAINDTSLDYQTLRNYAWVCRQFSVPRRRATLSFQHHAELASLCIDKQDEWLDKAETLGWSLHELRRQLKASGIRGPKQSGGQLTLRLTITETQKERWRLAAAASGADIEEWIVLTLDSIAGSTGDI